MKQDKINEIRESRSIHASTVPERQCDIDAVKLASHLGISQHIAAETLKNTTQSHRAQLWGHLPNRLLTRQSHMRFPRIKDIIYSNTFFASVPSKSRNNTCAQLFATANGFCEAYLMKTKGDAGDKLDAFITKHGISYNNENPENIFDGSCFHDNSARFSLPLCRQKAERELL